MNQLHNMKKLSCRHFLVIQKMQEQCDALAQQLLEDPEHTIIHNEAQNGNGNPDKDIIGLLYGASANFEQIIERQIIK